MKLNRVLVVAVSMAAMMMAGQVFAMAAVPSLMMGTRAVDVSGNIGDDGDDIQINMTGSVGYFYKDFRQTGLALGIDLDGSDYTAVNAAAFYEYNVDLQSQVVPYAGASIGLIWVDTEFDSDTAIETTGYGGVRYFFVDYAAIGTEAVIGVASEEIYNRGEDHIDWAIRVNTSWYF